MTPTLRRVTLSFAAFALAAATAIPASAQELPKISMMQAMQIKNTCQSDIDKFCAGVKQGEGRIAKCMLAHESEISPTCRAKVKEIAGK